MSKKNVGWEVELNNGDVLKEGKVEWRNVPKKDIIRLSLFHFSGRRWDLFDKEAYFVRNTASMVPGIQESTRIEKRCIGYYEGNKKVHYMVDEPTGVLEILIEEN